MYPSQIGLKVKIRQSGSVLEHIVYVTTTVAGIRKSAVHTNQIEWLRKSFIEQ